MLIDPTTLIATINTLNYVLTLSRPAKIVNSHAKTKGLHVALSRNLSGPVSATDPVKGSKDAASLLVCTRKKIFAWAVGFFVSDVISGGLLGHLALGSNH